MAKDMKRRDVLAALNRNGCELLRTDGIHDVYGCPCGQHRFALPRHRTVSPGVVRKAHARPGVPAEGMAAVKTYEVTVEREGRWWMVHVPELNALTQARRWAEVEEMARSLVAITLDVEPDTFDLDVTPPLDEDVAVELATAAEMAATAERAAAEASMRRSNAASMLKDRGWTVRDIGALLGVSFQRAHQLTQPRR